MSTPRKRCTIKEVAARSGVSVATVSNVLQNKSHLYSPETAERVWQAVRELGYRPSSVARSLIRQRTDTVGVILEERQELVLDPYVMAVLEGILEYTAPRNYPVKIVSMLYQRSPDSFLAHVDDGSVDGVVLLAPRTNSAALQWAQRTDIPAVVAGSTLPETPLPCVDVDDVSAIQHLVRWLIEQGHRRIGHLAGPQTQWSAQRRLQTYLRTMQEAGLCVESHWVVEGRYTPPSGKEAMTQLLQQAPELTAVVCANDWMALGALEAIHQQGLRIPEDISVTGFDDIDAAQWVSPPLTTMRQPMRQIGLKAAEVLLKQMESGERSREVFLFPAELVVRKSVAPPR
ncbi:MAG: LacI family DNA-binding transcriptional regulator [Armatimonadota bacterium]|nr:LacI family transcriptional regulator [bacterium]MCS7308759.1 LacI family transcriptional regulator [Armatimonadota bacterium]MDW8103513.1 LacI family DNA-binding transcriptional regulator [Armatimonadota bacterium]MDW8289305.1 LacI family DNA-binding transcriptional regulator [Armatimonadota bacterium]